MAAGGSGKTSRPRLPAVLARPRLFEAIEAQLTTGGAVWVFAPPGAGKSTLAADFSIRRQCPCIWYRLDGSDNDLAAFFRQLAGAAAPGQPLPQFVPGIHDDPAAFARIYFDALYAGMPAGTLVVLDDCQLIGDGEPLHAVLATAIESAPPTFGLLLLSRTPAPGAYARLRLNRTLSELAADALRLEPPELEELALLSGARLSAATAATLHERSQGWAAGAILLLAAGDDKAPAAPDVSPLLFDYFLNEVYARFDAATRHLLLHAALLPVISLPLLGRLVKAESAGETLAQLYARRFFVDRLDDDTYHLHPLFRDFLRQRAGIELGAGQVGAIRRRAAALLSGADQTDAAAELLMEAGETDGLRRLVGEHAEALLASGRHRTLLAWLDALPAVEPKGDPWLALWRGRGRLLQSPADARADLEQAFHAFRAYGDTRGTFEAWCAVIESVLQQWDDFTELDHWLALFPQLEASRRFYDSPRLGSRAKMMQLTALLFRAPNDPQLPALATHADRLTRLPLSPELRLRVGAQLVRYHMWRGEFGRATVVTERLRRVATTASEPLALLIWHHMEAFYLWFTHPRDGRTDAIDAGLAVAERSGIHILDIPLNAQGAYAALGNGDLPAAEHYLDAVRARLRTDRRLDQSHYHYLAGWYALATGDGRLALEHAGGSLAMAQEAGTPFPEAMAHMVCAQAHYATADFEAGDRHLAAALQFAEAMPSPIMEYVCRLSSADALDRRGDRESALAALKAALALGRQMSYETALWWSPQGLARLCALALEADVEPEYVRAVIRSRELRPPDPAQETWPWAIRIRALGPFTVELAGQPLRFSGKAQQRPLEMLQVIVAQGGTAVPKEQVIDALWPEQAGDAAVRSFNTTLHRLRRLLGDDAAIQLSEGRLTLDPTRCWLDVNRLQQVSARLTDTLARDDGDRIAQCTAALAEAYPGPLLYGQTAPWVLHARERLRRRIQRHTALAGERLEALGHWSAAETTYRAALELDPLSERLYQGLMRSLLARDQRSEAVQTYLACRRIIAAELGVVPAPATVRLAREAGVLDNV